MPTTTRDAHRERVLYDWLTDLPRVSIPVDLPAVYDDGSTATIAVPSAALDPLLAEVVDYIRDEIAELDALDAEAIAKILDAARSIR